MLSLNSGGWLEARGSRDDGAQTSSDSTTRRSWLVVPGDLVINPMWLVGGGVAVSSIAGAVSPDYRVFKVNRETHDLRYLHHLLRSQPYRDQYSLYTRADTTFDRRVSRTTFAALPVLTPPLATQRRIADMLDTETARIDTLIGKNERVLELLSQRATALITAAVTGAVEVDQFGDPRPPRRGDAVIPAQTVPLRYLARLDPGKSEVKHLPDDLEVDFIPMEAVGHGGRLAPTETRPLGEVRDGYTYLKSGDVTFAKISPSFQNRKGGRAQGLTNGLAFATTELTILRPEPATDARFLQYVIESEPFIQHGAATLHGVAGQQRVDLSRVAAFPVWSPDIDTQRRIADMLDAEIEKTDALKSTVNRQQELLRLRRQALITAAVTGQIEA